MRNLTLLLLLAIAGLASTGDAQAQRLWAGARAGVARSSLGGDYDDIFGGEPRSTFTGSAVLGLHATRILAFQAELAYVRKGVTGEIDPAGSYTVDLRYIELQMPLLLTVPVAGGRLRPRAYSGISLAYELSCDFEGKSDFFTGNVPCGTIYPGVSGGVIIFTETNPFEMGWLLGTGLDVALGPGALTLDLRFNRGLTDINSLPTSMENRTLQVLAGYVFYFGGPYEPARAFPRRPGKSR